MVTLFIGENDFLIGRAVQALQEEFKQQFGMHGIERVEGESLDVERLQELLAAQSLFAPQRLVIIDGLSSNKAVGQALLDALDTIADNIHVVIAEPMMDKKSKLFRRLQEAGSVRSFNLPTESELRQWITKVVEEQGGTIDATASRYLIERAGKEQRLLEQEIEKLVNFAPNVTIDSINGMVELTPVASAFELLDAVFSGQARVFEARYAATAREEDPYKFIGLLTAQLYALCVVRAAGRRSQEEVTKQTGIHPFVLRKIRPLANRLDEKQVSRLVEEVVKCDVRMKSSGIEPWILIEQCLRMILMTVITTTKPPV